MSEDRETLASGVSNSVEILEAQLSKARTEEKATATLAILRERCRDGKKLPSRRCLDILPYRYSPNSSVDLGPKKLTIRKFAQLARFLSRTQIDSIAAHDPTFYHALSILPEEEDFHPFWFECFLKWKTSSPIYAILFLREVVAAIELQGEFHEPLHSATDPSLHEPRLKRRRVDTAATLSHDSIEARTNGEGIPMEGLASVNTLDAQPAGAGLSTSPLGSIGDIYYLTNSDVELVVGHTQICGTINMIDTYEKGMPSLVSFYISEMASNHFIKKYGRTGVDALAKI
ncbi:hypothetical protein F4778DRAFT_729035 [Xylariomycetidae sp. FL2044]|nr:hypothetical protein F4778DRAFT_729035 [Xylariomycetidae sp. FL2044]